MIGHAPINDRGGSEPRQTPLLAAYESPGAYLAKDGVREASGRTTRAGTTLESNDPGRLTARVGITMVGGPWVGPHREDGQPPRMLRKQSLQ